MKRMTLVAALTAFSVLAGVPALAGDMSSKDMSQHKTKTAATVVEVVVGSPDHTTLAAAVKAAGLVETLSGKGPFTVFAPTNEAFKALPAGTVDNLLKPANKADLTKILTYHVVAGDFDAAAVTAAIEKGHGKAELKTVEGGPLTASLHDGHVVLTDAKGGTATVTKADLKAGNGVIHVIDKVLMP